MQTKATVQPAIELTADQAAALYKLIKRMGFSDYKHYADSKAEACHMRSALYRVRSAIEQ